VTEISQIENKDEVRSICFAVALQTYFGIWRAGLEMKFLRNQYRIGNSTARVPVILFMCVQSLTGPADAIRIERSLTCQCSTKENLTASNMISE
jgi:hypothetical protein